MENCIYCTNIEKRDSLMIKICDIKCTEVFLLRDQWHPGRCVVAYKGHKKEYFELTEQENIEFFEVVSKVAKAIYTIYNPGKINYLTMGDEMPHVHMHIVPKFKELESWNGFFNGRPQAFLSDEEYAQVIEKIKAEIL